MLERRQYAKGVHVLLSSDPADSMGWAQYADLTLPVSKLLHAWAMAGCCQESAGLESAEQSTETV